MSSVTRLSVDAAASSASIAASRTNFRAVRGGLHAAAISRDTVQVMAFHAHPRRERGGRVLSTFILYSNTQQLPAAQISVLSLTLLLLRELTPLFIRNRVCTAQGAAPCYTSTFSGHFVRYDRSILPPRSPSPARLVRDSVSDSRREAEYLCGLWLRPSVLRSLPLAVKSALGDVRRAARPMSPLPPHTPRTALPAHCGTYLYVTLTVSSRRRTR